jgi:hypothetical protein
MAGYQERAKAAGNTVGGEERNPAKHLGRMKNNARKLRWRKLRTDGDIGCSLLIKTGNAETVTSQYSSGKSNVVAERSASVMTQSFTPVRGSANKY